MSSEKTPAASHSVRLLLLLCVAAYAWTLGPEVTGGDAAEAYCIVTSGEVHRLPCFFLHHLLAASIIRACSWVGAPSGVGFNLLSFLAACGVVFLGHRLLGQLGLGERASFVGAFTIAFSGLFWVHAVNGDVYVIWSFFCVGSFVCFERSSYLTSGLWLGLAAMTYPGTGFYLPYFGYYVVRGPRTRRLGVAKAGIIAVLVCVPLWLATYQEYFFGRMGILASASSASLLTTAGASGPSRALAFLAFSVTYSLNFLLLPAIWGAGLVVARALRGQLNADALAALSLGAIYPAYLFGTAGTMDDAYVLPAAPLAGALVGVACDKVSESRRGALVVAVILVLFVSFSALVVVRPFGRALTRYHNEYRALGLDAKLEPSDGVPRLWCDWASTVILNIVIHESLGHAIEYPRSMYEGPCGDIEQLSDAQRSVLLRRLADDEVFLLETPRLLDLGQRARRALGLPHVYRRPTVVDLFESKVGLRARVTPYRTDDGRVEVWRAGLAAPEHP